MKFLNSREVRDLVLKRLEGQFGFSGKLDFSFVVNNKGRVYAVSRDVSLLPLNELRVNSLGFYFATSYPEGLRLSIEGAQLVGGSCSKNVLELSEGVVEEWLKGFDLELDNPGGLDGFVIVKSDKDVLGCGKVRGGKLYNYVPKTRRLKTLNP